MVGDRTKKHLKEDNIVAVMSLLKSRIQAFCWCLKYINRISLSCTHMGIFVCGPPKCVLDLFIVYL